MLDKWDGTWPTIPLKDGSLVVYDHLGGFDSNFQNKFLASLPSGTVYTEYCLPQHVKAIYPNLTIKFDSKLATKLNHFNNFVDCEYPPGKVFDNFLCCFNRSNHNSRQWLCWHLYTLDWFNAEYCSKNFVIPTAPPPGLTYKTHSTHDFSNTELFCNAIVNFGKVDAPINHQYNRSILDEKIQKSFLNLVSETVGESMVPFPTEKLLYPISNKTLWVAYAQPGYHAAIQRLFRFKIHNCFDYSFDSITDPIKRLVALTDMLSKFTNSDTWKDIYAQEQAVLDFNFEHCRSGNFIKHFDQFDETQ
jgi:hypothetical protein